MTHSHCAEVSLRLWRLRTVVRRWPNHRGVAELGRSRLHCERLIHHHLLRSLFNTLFLYCRYEGMFFPSVELRLENLPGQRGVKETPNTLKWCLQRSVWDPVSGWSRVKARVRYTFSECVG